MTKDLTVSMLMDFYGQMLTDKRYDALDMYYNQDLSLAEIAEEMGISRQGVMAFLRQGEKHLRDFEDKLGLADRFSQISEKTEEMRQCAERISEPEIKKEILQLIQSVSDII